MTSKDFDYELYFTPSELARRLRCSVDTIERAIKNGQLVAVRLGQRRQVIAPEEVSKWLGRGSPTGPRHEATATR